MKASEGFSEILKLRMLILRVIWYILTGSILIYIAIAYYKAAEGDAAQS